MEIINRAISPSKESFFLFGPRGTGKSTFVKNFYPDALYVDLLMPDTFRNYSAYPERLAELISANPEKKTIVIDEIQKIPQLLEVVHSLIEKKKGFQFVLTGSSTRKLKAAGVNLLGGRALLKRMHPFTAHELGNQFNLEKALNIGLLPIILNSRKPESSLSAFIDLYIKEEVQMEGLTRNIGNFTRFLEAVSFSHGPVINVSNIARECQVERKVVEGYIGILEDLLLAFKVPVFTKRAKRALGRHSKLYLFDAGVYNTLRPSGPLDRPEEKAGAALEGLVAQHLRAWIDYSHNGCNLFFWRTRSGNEVDFIVYGKDLFKAIEVKNTAVIRPKDIKSLKTFAVDYPEAERILVYRGKEKLLRDGILLIPCKDFLASLF